MKNAIISLLAAASLAGCATIDNTPKTRDEWNMVHSRVYPAPQPDVEKAVEKTLTLADHDFKFDFPPNQTKATRIWTVYAVLAISTGTDYWLVDYAPADGGGTKVTVQISRQAGLIAPSPVVGGGGINGVAASQTSTPGQPWQFPEAYDLFFSRISSMLGAGEWQNCKTYKASHPSKGIGNALNVLCSVNTDDRLPADPPR